MTHIANRLAGRPPLHYGMVCDWYEVNGARMHWKDVIAQAARIDADLAEKRIKHADEAYRILTGVNE